VTQATATQESEIILPSDQDASGRTLGAEELALLAKVIESGTLTSTKGTFVGAVERRFADMLGSDQALACSSGTGAIHAAVVAIDPEPGEEIVTTSITDMGAITPILYQGAIPVFANFCSRILGIEPLLIGSDDAVASVEVINAAYGSLAEGGWVTVDSAPSGRPAALLEVATRPAQ
jgi:cystathionine beta-lyase/cystathionine gamma-synthase